MAFIQYVGESPYHKVFVNVSNRFYKKEDGDFAFMENSEQVITPIKESDFESWLTRCQVSGRLQVKKVGEAYIADEAHRDSFPFHIPGFKRINELAIGEIIPIGGFRTPSLMSQDDFKLVSESIKLAQYLSFHRKK